MKNSIDIDYQGKGVSLQSGDVLECGYPEATYTLSLDRIDSAKVFVTANDSGGIRQVEDL